MRLTKVEHDRSKWNNSKKESEGMKVGNATSTWSKLQTNTLKRGGIIPVRHCILLLSSLKSSVSKQNGSKPNQDPSTRYHQLGSGRTIPSLFLNIENIPNKYFISISIWDKTKKAGTENLMGANGIMQNALCNPKIIFRRFFCPHFFCYVIWVRIFYVFFVLPHCQHCRLWCWWAVLI
jgi:hypothetical protein